MTPNTKEKLMHLFECIMLKQTKPMLIKPPSPYLRVHCHNGRHGMTFAIRCVCVCVCVCAETVNINFA